MFKKCAAILLVILLLFTFAACDRTQGSTNPTTTSQQAITTAPSTVPDEVPQPRDLYNSAKDSLLEKTDISVVLATKETLTLPADVFVTESTQRITYLGLGTNSLHVHAEDTAKYGSVSYTITEIFGAGKAYLTCDGVNYLSDIAEDDYLGRFLPLVLIDEANYESCTLSMNGSNTVITFADCKTLESWMDRDGVKLLEAKGTAVLDSTGALIQYTYDVQYQLLGGKIDQKITVAIEEPKKDNIELPSDTTDHITLSSPDIVKLLNHAYARCIDATSVTYNSSEQTVCQAAGTVSNMVYSLNTFGTGAATEFQLKQDYQFMDYQTGGNQAWSTVERFEDSKYSISIDGGEAEYDNSITANDVIYSGKNFLTSLILDSANIVSCSLTDLGDVLLLEAELNKEIGQSIQEGINYDLFQKEDFLDSLASSYETTKLNYYIGIDKYFGLPTGAGLEYEGKHVIDGTAYILTQNTTDGIYLGSMDAYEALNEEAAPDTVPSESPTPLFYHVTGKDGQELWLLGTIHVGDGRTGVLPQKLMDAFHSSDALAVECDPSLMESQMQDSALAEEFAKAYYYLDGSTTESHITDAELYEYAVMMMKASGSYSPNVLNMKTALWENTISNYVQQLSYCLSSDKGVDSRLLQMAKQEDKKVLQVESNLSQIKMLTGWSDKLSEVLLADILSQELTAYTEELMHLYELWCAGDEAALIDYLKPDLSELTEEDRPLWEEYNKGMSTDRNRHMAQVAIDYLESGETVFYAVGLAHVVAEDGLVNALRDAGYTVELVTYN